MEQEQTKGGKIITGNGMVRIEAAAEPRWFSIKHNKCGSEFTMNMAPFIDEYKGEHDFWCLGCHKKINEDFIKELHNFFSKYDELIKSLEAKEFSINEITVQESDSNS